MLRGRLVLALGNALGNRSTYAIASTVGCDPTTVQRRGADLDAWPLRAALDLAVDDQQLAQAMIDYLQGTAVDGSAVRALPALFAELELLGGLVAQISMALADGRVDQQEARALADRFRCLLADAQQTVAHLEQIGGAA